jgi:hypothetical protein
MLIASDDLEAVKSYHTYLVAALKLEAIVTL